MASGFEETYIDAPVGAVWGIHTRPETILQVSVNTTRYQPQGPMGKGCTIHGATKVIGRTVEWTAMVVEFNELRGYRLKSLVAPVQWELAYSYRPEGRGTVVRAEQWALGLDGFFGRISEAFIVRRYRRDLGKNLANLKVLVEAEQSVF